MFPFDDVIMLYIDGLVQDSGNPSVLTMHQAIDIECLCMYCELDITMFFSFIDKYGGFVTEMPPFCLHRRDGENV